MLIFQHYNLLKIRNLGEFCFGSNLRNHFGLFLSVNRQHGTHTKLSHRSAVIEIQPPGLIIPSKEPQKTTQSLENKNKFLNQQV